MPVSEKLTAYFGDKVLTAGFLPVPHLFRRNFRKLGIDESTAWFVLELLALAWDPSPARTLGAIAKEMGRDIATVRRHSQKLQDLKLIVVHDAWEEGHRAGNDYDLTPLWHKLATFLDDDSGDARRRNRTTRPRGTRNPKHDTDAAATHVEHPFNRASTRDMNDTGTRYDAHERANINRKKEDKEQQEAADAAAAIAIFGQLVSESDAAQLVAHYPSCIPHATAIVEEAARGKKPAGLLIHLVKSGWAPPRTIAEDTAATGEATDGARLCPHCHGDLTICNGIHLWMEPAT